MRNWQVEDDVTVVYPSGTVRNGTIARCRADNKFCILFYAEEGQETADPNVREHWLRVPGAHIQASAPPPIGL